MGGIACADANGDLHAGSERHVDERIRLLTRQIAQERRVERGHSRFSTVAPLVGNCPGEIDSLRRCLSALQCVEWALSTEPLLAVAFPAVERLIRQQQRLTTRPQDLDGYQQLHIQLRNCLAQLASQWGYNQPHWLKKALPLIGDRSYSRCAYEIEFARSERASHLMGEILCRAIQVQNLEVLKIARSYIPPRHLHYCQHIAGGAALDFLHFLEMEMPLASRLGHRDRWAEVELAVFTRCFGEKAALALAQISPAFNCQSDEVMQEVSPVLVAEIAKIGQVKLPKLGEVFESLEDLAQRALQPHFPLSHRHPQLTFSPLATFPDEHLQHVPFRLLTWHLQPEQLPPSSSLQSSCQVAGDLANNAPKVGFRAPFSVFESLAILLYQIPSLSEDIREMTISLLKTTRDKGKARLRLRELIERSPLDKSVAYQGSTREIREGFLCTTYLVCYLIGHLYRLQFRVSGALHLPVQILEGALLRLTEDMRLCGFPELGLQTHLVSVDEGAHFSISINRHEPWRGEIFLIEQSNSAFFDQLARLNEESPPDRGLGSSLKNIQKSIENNCALNYYCREIAVDPL